VDVPRSGDWDTVAGYVAATLERVPELGDEVALDSGRLRVERVDGSRIARLMFVPHDPEAADGQEALQRAVTAREGDDG
jgi:CBS domain containing-hemolysin-like protein